MIGPDDYDKCWKCYKLNSSYGVNIEELIMHDALSVWLWVLMSNDEGLFNTAAASKWSPESNLHMEP